MRKFVASVVLVAGIFGITGSAGAEVYWKPYAEPLQVEPTEITTSWGTSSSTIYFEQLEWTDWGSPEAVATGKAKINTCEPFCLAGNYVTVDAKVWLSNIRIICGGIDRYMHIRVAWRHKGKWWGEDYDDVTCRGSMVNPGGNPFPNLAPRPKPRPRLKRITGKSLFNRTVKYELELTRFFGHLKAFV